jgi:indoleamine 2,3-dioxygenase
MSPSSFDFPVMGDTRPDDTTLPAFMVSTSRGFLPRQEPIVELPREFAALESLLQRMPIKTLSGETGLLGNFTFGDTVLKELPDLSPQVEKYRDDLVVMNALYRDYSFLASAYLFEPCHERHMRGEEYGLGRQSLPRCIALPIVKVAEMYVLCLPSFPCPVWLTTSVPASSLSWNMLAPMHSSTIVWKTQRKALSTITFA